MGYQDMTVAELKAECRKLDLTVPAKAKKADLTALLESLSDAVEVEPETVDDTAMRPMSGLAVEIDGREVRSNLDMIGAELDARLAFLADWEPDADDPDDVAMCKRTSADLNAIAKQVDEVRKSIEREWNAPLEAFKAECKAVKTKALEGRERIKAVSDLAESRRREAKSEMLAAQYREMNGHFADLVPYERIEDAKWLNKGVPIEQALDEMQAKVAVINDDWQTLRSMCAESPDYTAIEQRFLETLSLSEASRVRAELEAHRAKMPAGRPASTEPEPMPARAETAPQTAPQPLQTSQTIDSLAASVREWWVASPHSVEAPTPRTMLIDGATTEQLLALGKLAGAIGVHGRFTSEGSR